MSDARYICEGTEERPHGRVIFTRYTIAASGPVEGGCPVCTALAALSTAIAPLIEALRKASDGTD